jgi:hypothetical protein
MPDRPIDSRGVAVEAARQPSQFALSVQVALGKHIAQINWQRPAEDTHGEPC